MLPGKDLHTPRCPQNQSTIISSTLQCCIDTKTENMKKHRKEKNNDVDSLGMGNFALEHHSEHVWLLQRAVG